MRLKDLQMTYKRDEGACKQALADLERLATHDDSPVVDFDALPDLPEKGDEHVAIVYPKK